MSPVRSRSPAPAFPARLPAPPPAFVGSPLLAFLDLYNEVGDGFALRHQHLVGLAGGNVNHVAPPEFLAGSTRHGCAANLAGSGRCGIDDFASGGQRRVAVENVEEVGEVLMQFAAAAPAAKGKHGEMPRILLQRLAGRAVSL